MFWLRGVNSERRTTNAFLIWRASNSSRNFCSRIENLTNWEVHNRKKSEWGRKIRQQRQGDDVVHSQAGHAQGPNPAHQSVPLLYPIFPGEHIHEIVTRRDSQAEIQTRLPIHGQISCRQSTGLETDSVARPVTTSHCLAYVLVSKTLKWLYHQPHEFMSAESSGGKDARVRAFNSHGHGHIFLVVATARARALTIGWRAVICLGLHVGNSMGNGKQWVI